MARLARALALNLVPVSCLLHLVPLFLFLLLVLGPVLSVQTRLTLALLKDRPCRSSPVPPRSSPTSFTVENSSGLPFSPSLAEPPLPLFLSPSARPPPPPSRPPAAFLVGQDDDTSTLHCGLERVSRRRSVESKRSTAGNIQRPQEGTFPTPSCTAWYRPVLFGDPCLARPSRHRTPDALLQVDRRCSR